VEESKVIHEITPLMGKDVLYIADRRKKEFTYPIHNHEVYELNFVEHAAGVRRIVGDSSEVIGDYDLVLITSPDLEHVWEQNECTSQDIREVTIQFDFDFSDSSIFGRNPFNSMRKMMVEAQKGLCFPMDAIMKVYQQLHTLSSIKDGFYAFQQFLAILYELSRCDGARSLASSSFAKVDVASDSRKAPSADSSNCIQAAISLTISLTCDSDMLADNSSTVPTPSQRSVIGADSTT